MGVPSLNDLAVDGTLNTTNNQPIDICENQNLLFFFSGEMIDKLTLKYNRTRQAVITTELIDIVTGASAL